MKTAISLPDAIFQEADLLASRMHLNRSQLYALALEKFIKEHREGETTERINDFIEKLGQPVDPTFLKSSHHDMRKVEW